jgi:pyrroline-5-carboxylate reductase
MVSAGFIGGVRVTRILVGGWARAGALPARILVHDPNGEALDALESVAPHVERVSSEVAAGADVVFVALHPPAVVGAISPMKANIRSEAVLVSLAPRISIAMLEDAAGTRRIARMIPNAPSIVGRGFNPVTFGPGLDARARETLAGLFEPWGQAPEVPETTLEAYALLTGMGPTYFWYQWQALREVASELGLRGSSADEALRAMVDGALATLLDSGLTPAAVMDLVPVKPLAELEAGVTAAYRTTLPALHTKIQPPALAMG